ncbi:hypothetical protein CWE15_06275 [Aliidiomarina taiwanensis]|uniref:Flagellar biosynthesis protein FlgT n=1 Tax=Aliidiomarina taiwanensis TaxID=946228 RepID=A0A432X827_9GAMM|nr:flagellar assembly protein T N-terminal domain-containing protein [Aliidiomarina taiwanensis]RUO43005.1 hypothetical protein CWE15_06275 [Aliidiomarina taiwanensis]
MWRLTLFLLALVYAGTGYTADWYETRGWAPIINGNVEAARERAIENALRESLDLAGGTVHSVEDVVNGVLTGQRLQWRSNGAIEHASLVRERTNGQRHEVTLRTLVRPNVNACEDHGVKRSVLITPFAVAQREHLAHGQVYELDAASSFRFSRLVGQHSQSLIVSQTLPSDPGLTRYLTGNHTEQLADFTRRQAREFNSQYIIAGVFHDISATPQPGPRLLFWRHPKYNRQFELSLYLLDGYSGERITTASITGEADWDYPYNAAVDVHSELFWRQGFGQELEAKMRDLVYGLEQKVQCTPVKGLVVRASDGAIHSNLGERQQLSIGTRARILHRGGFLDELGQYREQWVLNPTELEVTQVYASSSELRSVSGEPLVGIQARDMVILQ